jgi:hypothetical protein
MAAFRVMSGNKKGRRLATSLTDYKTSFGRPSASTNILAFTGRILCHCALYPHCALYQSVQGHRVSPQSVFWRHLGCKFESAAFVVWDGGPVLLKQTHLTLIIEAERCWSGTQPPGDETHLSLPGVGAEFEGLATLLSI